ncbi:uncharacterized protein ARMOST_00185 [Armillaria ostoyae]|uniref:Uncharacterized protein n=1 Tax=Armillaria ostoyae TaxID=47428 RepID=A0A284QKD3_ARMOS|nr:uncharacterized protein ARMOST_00185 [Armillaria ostoyae]
MTNLPPAPTTVSSDPTPAHNEPDLRLFSDQFTLFGDTVFVFGPPVPHTPTQPPLCYMHIGRISAAMFSLINTLTVVNDANHVDNTHLVALDQRLVRAQNLESMGSEVAQQFNTGAGISEMPGIVIDEPESDGSDEMSSSGSVGHVMV